MRISFAASLALLASAGASVACTPARREPSSAAASGAEGPCSAGEQLSPAGASEAELARADQLGAGADFRGTLEARWTCNRKESVDAPADEQLDLTITRRKPVACKVQTCVGDPSCEPHLRTPVHVELVSQSGTLHRSFDADLQIREDGALWLTHVSSNVDDPALRGLLSVREGVRMQEDVFVRLVDRRAQLSVSYGHEEQVMVAGEATVLGTGGCELSSLDAPQPLPAL
jgi:hypothetical protein